MTSPSIAITRRRAMLPILFSVGAVVLCATSLWMSHGIKQTLDALPTVSSLQGQKDCSEESLKFALSHGYKGPKSADQSSVALTLTYTNHYNSKRNQCFVTLTEVTESRDSSTLTSQTTYNAFELTPLAKLITSVAMGATEQIVMNCSVLTPSGAKTCASAKEFDDLVAGTFFEATKP